MGSSPSTCGHKIVGHLGKGSYASVCLAHHRNTNELIAVKKKKSRKSSSLVKENRILESFCGCSEIIQCYGNEITVIEGVEYYNLLLEYGPAGTLSDVMRRSGGCLSKDIDVKIYAQMTLQGLSCIHAKGIVHCDIKPDNILAYPSEHGGLYQLKIADFGMATKPREELSEGSYRGTIAYMSPEVMAPGEIDAAMAIWSFGCIVVKMVTGNDPWQGMDNITIINMTKSREKPPKIPENMSAMGQNF